MGTGIETISSVYEAYFEDIQQLRASLKPTDGLLGFGKNPASDPCHGVFAEGLEKALTELVRLRPGEETAAEVLRYIFTAPRAHEEDKLSYWMLIAVHGMAGELVSFLSPTAAAELLGLYERQYPKYTLLPAQQQVLKNLRARAGINERPRKRGLFRR